MGNKNSWYYRDICEIESYIFNLINCINTHIKIIFKMYYILYRTIMVTRYKNTKKYI